MSDQTVENLLREGRSRMVSMGAELAMVMIVGDDGELTVRKAQGLSKPEDIPRRSPFFERARKGESLLLMDATKDHRFKAVPDEIRSVLCVPIRARAKIIGILYGESPKPGRFSHKNQTDATKYGELLGTDLEKAEGEPLPVAPAKAAEEAEDGKAVFLLRITAFLLVLAVVWPLTVSYVTREKPPPTARAIDADVPRPDPTLTVNKFLELVKGGKIDEAYALLSPGMQQAMPRKTFGERVATWMKNEENTKDLPNRKVKLSSQDSQTAILVLESKGGREWKWKLVIQAGEWRLEACRGGPAG